jgi:hypothetical protein
MTHSYFRPTVFLCVTYSLECYALQSQTKDTHKKRFYGYWLKDKEIILVSHIAVLEEISHLRESGQ